MKEKTITPEVTQEQQITPTQFDNLILNELNRPRPTPDTIAILQFCVNVGILPDNYTTNLVCRKQPPYVPPTQKEEGE